MNPMDDFYNRELSWLAFNRRVLQEAGDKSVPLFQRLRFLGIYSNNNDEFVKVRVANLVRIEKDKREKNRILSGGYRAKDLLSTITGEIDEAQKKFSRIYEQILSEMAALGIHMVDETMLNGEQEQFCRTYFLETVSRRIIPLFLRKTVPIPFLPDHEIYLGVCMKSKKTSKNNFAILQIPVGNSCPRFIQLPSVDKRCDIIFQDDIIRLCLKDIFFMFSYDSIQAFTFKLIRDASLTLDDDLSKSLLEKMEKGLGRRLHGKPVRLIYDREMPDDLLRTLASKLKLKENELQAGGRYHMMRDLIMFPVLRRELESPPMPPQLHPDIVPFSGIFKKTARKDILLAFPYQTFTHVIDFLRESAVDPKVESIHITLYRTAPESKVVTALVSAAQNGKKVVAFIELMARFDEEHNADIVDELQKAGIQVIHGVPSLKVHCKLLLVRRRESAGNCRGYVYIGTGNFNEATAKIYSDFGLLTSDKDFAADARTIFSFLVTMHKRFVCKKLLTSPYFLRRELKNLINREIKNAKEGKHAYIYIKCNNITDEKIINHIYKAGMNGVDIRIIVRSSCCLYINKPSLSDNIKAVSIVDNFLEHARLMIFCNNDDIDVYISSADLMTRNLDRRLEIAAPILDRQLKKELKYFFDIQWSDNVKARDLAVAGENAYVRNSGGTPVRSQAVLYEHYRSLASGVPS
ncbi:MAG: polyphosphate kinase 1 [Desulfovibrio sp.]|jgi:polyphosphate kinase|nr:polyphosphate kinase 1 [Desulfovibrio sp.]